MEDIFSTICANTKPPSTTIDPRLLIFERQNPDTQKKILLPILPPMDNYDIG